VSKALLQKVITNGVDGNLNDFFLSVSNFYTEKDDDLADYNAECFTNFKGIGEINFEDGQKLVVVTANVTRDLTERSGKKDQYEKAKRILKFYTRYDAGIFVFSDNKRDFRLSLVYGTPDATRTVWSNFRRFTYYASPSLTNKTFLDRVGNCSFASLGVIKDAFSVEKVTKSFYQKIADWYFWAVQNTTFPADAEKETNGRNNAVIRLITRLIFIWFMKERELVPPELFKQDKIVALLKSLNPKETTYYKAILQNLFFATLNTRKQDRTFRFKPSYQGRNSDYMDHAIYRYDDYFRNREDMLVIFKDIPFLNGGLFDCLDWSAKESGTGAEVRFDGFSDKMAGLNIPNYLFFDDGSVADLNKEYGTKNKTYHVEGIINILSAYNFTIDENDPNDQEVALDPELLGKVFENLLASFNPETATTARKATGSYYTPREIVDYMVVQSLKQYYKTSLGDIADIDRKLDELLLPVSGEAVNPFDGPDSEKIVQLTEGLRIVDPAVGSGAFPMGVLNKLVSVLDKVDHDNKSWKKAQLDAVKKFPDPLQKQKFIEEINTQFEEKSVNYNRKLYLIQKCIYGVDIQQIAIEIAKLRFFIALLVDENIDKSNPDNWGIKPLPNLDFKLMQGDSLISEFMGINLDAEDSNVPAKLMKDETEELVEQFQEKKSEYQYEPDRKRKEALKKEINKLIEQIFESKLKIQKADFYMSLQQTRQKYADLPETPVYLEAKNHELEAIEKKYGFDIDKAEKQLKEFTSGLKVKPFFAWKLYFVEVFNEKAGFDIVITNPPYIGEKGHKEIFRQIKQGTLKEYYQGKMDIFYFFFHLAIDLCRCGAQIAFITTNYYPTATGASKLRLGFKNRTTIRRIVDFNELRIFESAQGQHNMITILSKEQEEKAIADTCRTRRTGEVTPQVLQNIIDWQDNETGYYKVSQKDLYEDEECYIRLTGTAESEDDPLQGILNKLKAQGQELIQFCNVNQGIVTGADKLSNRHIVNHGIKGSVGDGIFVLNREETASLSLPKKDKDLLKPWYKNSDIQRWVTSKETQENVIYLDRKITTICEDYRKHLAKYKAVLVQRREVVNGVISWWQLQWPRDIDFCGPKIVVPQRSYENTFAYNDIPWYASADVYYITEKSVDMNLKYCLALLNSKLYYLWLYHKGKRKGEMLELYQVPLSEIPIKKITKADQKPFISIVDKILAITQDQDYISNPAKQAKVGALECQIDHLVYQLYDLTKDEKAVVEDRLFKDNRNGITDVSEISSTEEVELIDQKENREEEAQVEIILTKDKETPGTWRYKEQKEDHPLTIYLTKEQVKELGSPESIKITITAA